MLSEGCVAPMAPDVLATLLKTSAVLLTLAVLALEKHYAAGVSDIMPALSTELWDINHV